MIMKLPNWVLVNKFPAFFDTESLTATEQTARIYGKINELIESYNKYVEEINKTITEYESEKDADVQAFICRISTLTLNYINTVDMKIMHQDRKIAEVYDKFSADVINTLKILLSDLKESGELDFAILDAISNLNEKVDEFITECEEFKASCVQFKEDMSADYQEIKTQLNADYEEKKTALEGDYQNTKSQLDSDYEEKKTALEGDYQETKTALDSDYSAKKTALDTDYNTTKENLSADYTETKAQLDSDYSAKKTALDTDYQNTKSQLDSDYEEKKIALTDSVAGYTDMFDNKNAVLFSCSSYDDAIPKDYVNSNGESKYIIQNLEKYKVVSVQFSSMGQCLCCVSTGMSDSVEVYKIVGSGSSWGNGGDLFIIDNVDLKIEKATGKVLENKTNTLKIGILADTDSHTVTVTPKNYITYIQGIV